MFIVQFEDVYAQQPGRLSERAEHMNAHLAFLDDHGDLVVAAGALRASADGVPTGGIWIVAADSKVAVEEIIQSDPFWKAGLRKSFRVSYWAKTCWSPGFTDCMTAIGEN